MPKSKNRLPEDLSVAVNQSQSNDTAPTKRDALLQAIRDGVTLKKTSNEQKAAPAATTDSLHSALEQGLAKRRASMIGSDDAGIDYDATSNETQINTNNAKTVAPQTNDAAKSAELTSKEIEERKTAREKLLETIKLGQVNLRKTLPIAKQENKQPLQKALDAFSEKHHLNDKFSAANSTTEEENEFLDPPVINKTATPSIDTAATVKISAAPQPATDVKVSVSGSTPAAITTTVIAKPKPVAAPSPVIAAQPAPSPATHNVRNLINKFEQLAEKPKVISEPKQPVKKLSASRLEAANNMRNVYNSPGATEPRLANTYGTKISPQPTTTKPTAKPVKQERGFSDLKQPPQNTTTPARIPVPEQKTAPKTGMSVNDCHKAAIFLCIETIRITRITIRTSLSLRLAILFNNYMLSMALEYQRKTKITIETMTITRVTAYSTTNLFSNKAAALAAANGSKQPAQFAPTTPTIKSKG